MHIHSIYEPGASMAGHMYFAKMQGIRHIWFTEHDILWCKKPFFCGFESSEVAPDENGAPTRIFERVCGDVKLDSEEFYEGSYSLRLTAAENEGEDWSGAGAVSTGKSVCYTLCCFPDISFMHRVKTHAVGDVRIIFDFCLSERPRDQQYAHILFVAGSSEGLEAPHTLIVPIEAGDTWQKFAVNVSEIASSEAARLADIGGLDNVFSYLTVKVETRRGASASLYIDSLSVKGRTSAAETKKNQTELAKKLGEEYGVIPFVTAEITVGGHKNCFSTNTPVFNYTDPENKTTNEEACRTMCEQGIAFAINHPFVHLKGDKGIDLDEECDALIKKYASDNAGGASLLEVGFPFGRYAPYTAHTKLWDGLAMRGVILTGHGATDSHMLTEGWFSGNNFASYVGVEEGKEPTEKDFSSAMKAGMLYAANPLVHKGEFSFFADGKREMGSVNVLPKGTLSKIEFSLGITNHNWKVVWVVNGERVRADKATRMGYRGVYEHITTGGIDVVRAELYDYFGTLLLMTNPIYFTSDIKNIKNDISHRPIYST